MDWADASDTRHMFNLVWMLHKLEVKSVGDLVLSSDMWV